MTAALRRNALGDLGLVGFCFGSSATSAKQCEVTRLSVAEIPDSKLSALGDCYDDSKFDKKRKRQYF